MSVKLLSWVVALRLELRQIVIEKSLSYIIVKILEAKCSYSLIIWALIIRLFKKLQLKLMSYFSWVFFLQNCIIESLILFVIQLVIGIRVSFNARGSLLTRTSLSKGSIFLSAITLSTAFSVMNVHSAKSGARILWDLLILLLFFILSIWWCSICIHTLLNSGTYLSSLW